MRNRLTILSALLMLFTTLLAAGCATGSSEVTRRGGQITLMPGDAEEDLYLIDRQAWDDAYARGPSWLIQQVRVRPVLRNGSFFGFQVLSLFPDRPVASPLAVKLGDIIRSVNGHGVERPDHFMKLWEANRNATSLSLQLIRDRRQLEVTWSIGAYPVTSPRSASATHVPPYPLPSGNSR
jgi:hypothetical protein